MKQYCNKKSKDIKKKEYLLGFLLISFLLLVANCQQGELKNSRTDLLSIILNSGNKSGVSLGQMNVLPVGNNMQDVVINEIAWMGTTASANYEWIELKNNTNASINLNGWTLNATDGTPAITLTGVIAAGGYYLLERTSDASVPDVTADQIYTGAMVNSGEYLELKNGNAILIDSVNAWYAGSNDTKSTMERIDALASGLNSSSWVNAVKVYSGGLGTPKAANGNSASDGNGSSANCNYPNQLEITSINIGQGDATLIASKTKLLLADAGESNWNSHNDANKIAEVIHQKYGISCNTIDYVVISHIHLDHIGYIQAEEDANGNLLNALGQPFVEGDNLKNPVFYAGLAYLVKNLGFTVGKTVLRDYVTNNPNKDPADGGSKTYRNWRAYLASPEGIASFHPATGVLGTSSINMGTINGQPVVVDIIQVDASTPANPNGCDPATYFGGAQNLVRGNRSGDAITPSENDLSLAFVVSFGNFNMYVGGDTSGQNYTSSFGYRYNDTESCIANDPILQAKYGGKLEVMRVNHHGSSHSTNQSFVDFLNPLASIFSVGDNNTYGHVDRGVLDRILYRTSYLNFGKVFMTESGAGVAGPADVCHSVYTNICAQVADNEFPATVEANEAGDAGVSITISLNGGSFSMEGDPAQGNVIYSSR